MLLGLSVAEGDGNALKEATMCNADTIARAGRACLAGLALVMLSAPIAEAVYGPRTVIGANYQQTSTTTSTNGITEGACNSTAICYILFQAPPQKALIVQHVSCRVAVRSGALFDGSLETEKGKAFPLKHTHLVPVPTTSTELWLVNSPVMHLVKLGEKPNVHFRNSRVAEWIIECSISGQLTEP
jgi:hypothetical protein